jgi:dTDP-4-dehydrorhamnose 3,5-epimerase-like enzyme
MPIDKLSDFVNGPILIEGPIFKDSRGEFRTVYAESLALVSYQEIPKFSQTNLIRGEFGALRGFHAGTIRSNHWKAVSCIQGEVLEAFLDLRLESTTFGQVRTYRASGSRNEMIIIPPGFGHGMQSITPNTISVYSTNVEYKDQEEIDVNPLSQEYSHFWINPLIISERDQKSKTVSELIRDLE